MTTMKDFDTVYLSFNSKPPFKIDRFNCGNIKQSYYKIRIIYSLNDYFDNIQTELNFYNEIERNIFYNKLIDKLNIEEIIR